MPSTDFHAENISGGIAEAGDAEARLVFRGTLAEGEHRVDFTETCTVKPNNRLTLRFDFTAVTDLNLRMWRHYFAFPVGRYANATARTDTQRITLPATVKDDALLPASKRVIIETGDTVVTVESSLSMSLVDHRKHGSEEYLLAGYPVHGAVKEGTKWTVEISAAVAAK